MIQTANILFSTWNDAYEFDTNHHLQMHDLPQSLVLLELSSFQLREPGPVSLLTEVVQLPSHLLQLHVMPCGGQEPRGGRRDARGGKRRVRGGQLHCGGVGGVLAPQLIKAGRLRGE